MRRFVGDVSHELRTPLAAISAYTELFERGAPTIQPTSSGPCSGSATRPPG